MQSSWQKFGLVISADIYDGAVSNKTRQLFFGFRSANWLEAVSQAGLGMGVSLADRKIRYAGDLPAPILSLISVYMARTYEKVPDTKAF